MAQPRKPSTPRSHKEKTVTGRVLHDPVKDKLRPIFPLDLSKCRTTDELVRAMGDTAFTGRQIGDAADVLEAMARDKDCFVVMTLSGALTVGKMGLIFCDLVESGVVIRTFVTTIKWATRNSFMRATTASTIPSNQKSIWTTSKR
jgi:deoxyhypusine synthase